MSMADPLSPEPNPYASPASSAPHSPPVASAAETRVDSASELVVELLRQTRPWALLFSVLGFIVSGIIVCAAAFKAIGAIGRAGPSEMGEAVGMLIISVLYFYPSLHLFRFAGRIRELSETHRLADLEAALREQKSFWKFCGVTVSVLLAFYALVLLGAFLLGGIRL